MKIQEWRALLADPTASEDTKREAMREAIIHLRADRKMACEVQVIKKTRASPKDAKALLEDFAAQMKQG